MPHARGGFPPIEFGPFQFARRLGPLEVEPQWYQVKARTLVAPNRVCVVAGKFLKKSRAIKSRARPGRIRTF